MLASHFFGNGVFYLLTLVTLAYVALALANKTRGAATVVVVILFNFVAEVWVADLSADRDSIVEGSAVKVTIFPPQMSLCTGLFFLSIRK